MGEWDGDEEDYEYLQDIWMDNVTGEEAHMRDREDNPFDDEDGEESVDSAKTIDECEKILTAMKALYAALPLNIADPRLRRNLEESYKFR